MTKTLALIVALLACACGELPFEPESEAEAWCSTHRCDYVDAAFELESPEFAPDVTRALEQLANVSREPIGFDDFGIPMAFVPVALDLEGDPVCGVTTITTVKGPRRILSIEIAVSTEVEGCPAAWVTVRHEVACHAIPGLGATHTESGACAASGGGGEAMDALSLGQMCLGLDGCPKMLH